MGKQYSIYASDKYAAYIAFLDANKEKRQPLGEVVSEAIKEYARKHYTKDALDSFVDNYNETHKPKKRGRPKSPKPDYFISKSN